jgi:hypothetical protein
MNFVLKINDFQIEYLHLFEKKKNIVIDGIFTKMIYSDKLLSMNGIYFNFPLEITSNQNNYLSYYNLQSNFLIYYLI